MLFLWKGTAKRRKCCSLGKEQQKRKKNAGMKKSVQEVIYTSRKEKLMYKILRTMELLSEPMPRNFPQQESTYQNLPGAAGKRIPKWFMVQSHLVTIFFKGMSRSINSSQSNGAIFMHFLYFIWSKPSSLKFSGKILQLGVI